MHSTMMIVVLILYSLLLTYASRRPVNDKLRSIQTQNTGPDVSHIGERENHIRNPAAQETVEEIMTRKQSAYKMIRARNFVENGCRIDLNPESSKAREQALFMKAYQRASQQVSRDFPRGYSDHLLKNTYINIVAAAINFTPEDYMKIRDNIFGVPETQLLARWDRRIDTPETSHGSVSANHRENIDLNLSLASLQQQYDHNTQDAHLGPNQAQESVQDEEDFEDDDIYKIGC